VYVLASVNPEAGLRNPRMRVLTKSKITYSLTLGLMLGLGVGAISALGTSAGWLPGLAILVGFLLIAMRKPLRRWRATRGPFPEWASDWLEEHVGVYPHLAGEARRRFDTDVQIILDEWRFEGSGQVKVTEKRRLRVAAGAALLLHGHPEWELPYRHTVLFYSEQFDDDYVIESEGEFDGMAHQQGPIILSVKALDECWQGDPGAGNVVLHELAHLLDYKTEFADGVPSLVDARSAVAWQALVHREMERIKRGRSILPDYGSTEPAELFACAVESFFEESDLLERRHPELFAALKALFNMDPRTGTMSAAAEFRNR
jgi:Mlc titration factor MtfA (ptsG expression regulator)